jgi:hypothetical protein
MRKEEKEKEGDLVFGVDDDDIEFAAKPTPSGRCVTNFTQKQQ